LREAFTAIQRQRERKKERKKERERERETGAFVVVFG
jgi:hypothetical protein